MSKLFNIRESLNETRDLKGFLFSQFFVDGLRTTIGVLFPSIIMAQFDMFEAGVVMSIGALITSIPDSPGPQKQKIVAMLSAIAIAMIMSILTGFAAMNTGVLLLELVVFSFFFSIFTIYGNRAASVGVAGLLIIILMMHEKFDLKGILLYSLFIGIGGLWYFVLSISTAIIRPYRQAERALGQCMMETAEFLRIKADCYNIHVSLDETFKRLVKQQEKISTQQDFMRELLFKTRIIVKESTDTSRRLMLSFVDLVDLYEQLHNSFFDYEAIRKTYGDSGITDKIGLLLRRMATTLDNTGYSLLINSKTPEKPSFLNELNALKTEIEKLEATHQQVFVLKRILFHLQKLNTQIHDINSYFFSDKLIRKPERKIEYEKFVNFQNYSPQLLLDNLNINSSSFRHALRVALACAVGFVVGKFIDYGHHSYWIVLTIIVILRPAFSFTRQRNTQRLLGTLLGAIIGGIIIFTINDKIILFSLLAIFMLISFSLVRLNYIYAVIFITIYVFILFKFLGFESIQLAGARLLDTFIGSAIALSSSYLLLPSWESQKISATMSNLLNANIQYFKITLQRILGENNDIIAYKLARKQVYVSESNLSAAFQRMTSEPKKRQFNAKEVHRFVVLNHIFSENIAGLNNTEEAFSPHNFSTEEIKEIKRAWGSLQESYKLLNNDNSEALLMPALPLEESAILDENLHAQLIFLHKISSDIYKTTKEFINKPTA